MNMPIRRKLWKFAESPITWGAIGVLVGAIGPFIPPKWGFIVTFAFLVMALLKTNFFEGGSLLKHILGNLVLIGIMAALLVEVWHLLPKPQEPLTSKELVEAFCKRSPWLCSPPEQVQPRKTVAALAPSTTACGLKFVTATEPVARLYSRHGTPTTSQANLSFD